MPQSPRGRPTKFGRPARIVALTLPDDVLAWLQSINSDPAWAVVSLFERTQQRPSRRPPVETAPAELVQLPGRRALIVVQPDWFKRLRGVSTIPLADGRAFLALSNGHGMADLELAIVDRLDDTDVSSMERRTLEQLRTLFRGWRRTPRLSFQTRSIIVVDRAPGADRPKSLAPLKRKNGASGITTHRRLS